MCIKAHKAHWETKSCKNAEIKGNIVDILENVEETEKLSDDFLEAPKKLNGSFSHHVSRTFAIPIRYVS